MVSLYNRLGGHILRWSKLKGQQWGGASLPIHHDGHFYNTEIKVGSKDISKVSQLRHEDIRIHLYSF